MRTRNSYRVIDRYPSHQLQHEAYREWSEYLKRFPWEWHATLTLEPGINFFHALKLFNGWRMRLIDTEKLRVGAYLLSAYKGGNIHFHALMVGRNREEKTLYDCSPRRWEGVWRFFARIQPVTDNSGVCDYVALHFLGFKSSRTEIDYHDRTLLRQVMNRQNDCLDNFDGLLAGGR